MKIEYSIVKGVIVTLLLALAGYVVYPMLGIGDLPAATQFAAALLVGSLLGGVLSSIRFTAAAARPAGTSGRATSPAASGDRSTVFVGNLAYRASQEEVRDLFMEFGEVYSVRLMTDRVTRRPRGFGFVEMNGPGAEAAIRDLNGREFMGRELKVNEGKQREPRMRQAA